MKLKIFLASFITIFFVLDGFAQQKKQNVYFMKNDGRYVDVKDSADFIRIVQEPDSGSALYNVLDYYPNNNLKMMGKSSTVDPILLEGMTISYYPDKKKKRIANFEHGVLHGTLFDYFPNGKLYRAIDYISIKGNENAHLPISAINPPWDAKIKTVQDSTGIETVTDGNGDYQIFDENFKTVLEEGRVNNGKRDSIWTGYQNGKVAFIEEYADGKFIKGTRKDEKGDTIIYTVKEALPTFKGGEQAFGKYLAQTLRYPKTAREQNIQGDLIVSYTIEKNGIVGNIKILKKLARDIEEEVIRTLRLSPKWSAGTKNGIPVPVTFTHKISFVLDGTSMARIIID